jgi:hypothetical protein
MAMPLSLRQTLKLAEADLAEAEKNAANLRGVVEGLRNAIALYQGMEDGNHSPRAGNGTIPRTDAILAVMRENPSRPMGVKDLAPLVGSKRNLTENHKAVSAGLSYLKAQGKVRSIGQADWLLAGVPDPAEPPKDPDEIPF